ncbi:MAG: hypothetical protein C4542_08235 [Dehalococcoidia bacterium]|nr:MAG: hypothetical protein C4542_08235 [Dehalococcoidia bacterium]
MSKFAEMLDEISILSFVAPVKVTLWVYSDAVDITCKRLNIETDSDFPIMDRKKQLRKSAERVLAILKERTQGE